MSKKQDELEPYSSKRAQRLSMPGHVAVLAIPNQQIPNPTKINEISLF
jgi:hypothetical protein